MTRFEAELLKYVDNSAPEIGADIIKNKKITDANEEALKKVLDDFKQTFVTSDGKR